jgi:isopentenyl-diphosphate Delta-isomerase
MSDHSDRKGDHLDLCATDDVAFRDKTTLLEQVQLIHNALPELATGDVNTSVRLLGHNLRAPLVIAAMTGGLGRAKAINRDLARAAEENGIAFGFGSMRPLLENGVLDGYVVRDVAPTTLIFGNIGLVQAVQASTQQLEDMVGVTGMNALVLHLNPAMELVQPGGDTDFRGGMQTIAQLLEELSVPIVVKETGCGLSRSVGRRLTKLGVTTVDVSGAGGTSWVGVETLRAKATRSLGEAFWDWGIPTAGSVAQLSGLPLEVIATGGVSSGIDVARALALGASAAGMARPFLKAWNEGGREAVQVTIDQVIAEVSVALLLTGSRTVADLQHKRLIVGSELRQWIPHGTPLESRLGT